MNNTLYLAARVFAILFILITALFALDLAKFSWEGLFMHLLPSLILLVILGITFIQEKIAGLLWILAAIAYVIVVWGDVTWTAYLMMAGPPLVIGILFLWPQDDTMYTPRPVASTPAPTEPSIENKANNS